MRELYLNFLIQSEPPPSFLRYPYISDEQMALQLFDPISRCFTGRPINPGSTVQFFCELTQRRRVLRLHLADCFGITVLVAREAIAEGGIYYTTGWPRQLHLRFHFEIIDITYQGITPRHHLPTQLPKCGQPHVRQEFQAFRGKCSCQCFTPCS